MPSAVEVGLALMLDQEARATASAQAQVHAEEQQLVGALGSQILGVLTAVLERLNALEAKQVETMQCVIASRVRRPIRDELGTILYVVDELQPPVWAQPVGSNTGEY